MFTIVKSTSKYALENSVTFLRWWVSTWRVILPCANTRSEIKL